MERPAPDAPHRARRRRRPRVLKLGPRPDLPGGIATGIRCELASDLAERYDLRVLPVKEREQQSSGALQYVGRACRVTLRLLWRLVAWRPAIVHVHASGESSFFPLSFFVLLCWLARRRIVIHIHAAGFDEYIASLDRRRRRWMERTFRRCDAVVVLSQRWKTVVQEVAPLERIHVIENFVIFPEMDPRQPHDGPVRVLMVGFVGPRKGVYDLISAARRLERAGETGITFRVAGGYEKDPVHWEETVRRVEQAGVRNLELLGSVQGEALVALYREADIFTLPTYAENQPRVILEALAAGLPIVSTPVAAIPETVGPAQAILVQPGDVDGLVEAFTTLARDPDRRAAMGAASLARYRERYSAGRYVEELDVLYRGLLGLDQ
jgi:glycosyltransferase involved in cell wall biosynthesis